MKRFLIKTGLFLLPIFIAVVFLFVMPYDKKFAYHYIEGSCFNRGEWVYERIFENQTPIDVAFIGTSHTLNAVQDSLLEHLINADSNDKFHLANLAYCWQGLNTQYVFLKDLLTNKSPHTIIFEVREWEDNSSHKIFPYISDAGDIGNQPYLFNIQCISNVYKSAIARLSYLRDPHHYQNTSDLIYDSYGFESINQKADTGDLILNHKKQLINYAYPNGLKLDDQMKNYDRYYFDLMMKLCEEKKVEICFLYLPAYGDVMDRPLNYELYSQFGDIYIPPTEIRDNKSYWANTSHLNNDGAVKLTNWLSTRDVFK